MKQAWRRRMHKAAAIFFAGQLPPAILLYLHDLTLFNKVGIIYLVLTAQWALVVGHWSTAEAATPEEEE